MDQDLDQLVRLERLGLDPLLVLALTLLLSDLRRSSDATPGLVFSQGIVFARYGRDGFQNHAGDFSRWRCEGSLWGLGEYPKVKNVTFLRPRPH